MSSRSKDSRPFLDNNNHHLTKRQDCGIAEEEAEENEVYCGIGTCRPSALQCCATMGVFSIAYSFSGLFTSTLTIYINSQITTLEKQFGFSSSVSGFILSCNDIGYLLTTLFMSYIARRTHIPRILGISTILFGLSGLICSIPYFVTKDGLHPGVNTTGIETGNMHGSRLCNLDHGRLNGNISLIDGCFGENPESKSIVNTPESIRTLAIVLLALGMIFQGFGKSPRYPFLATYVDDNVEKTKTTLYLGIITGLSIFGPAIAFVLGGVFSRMFVTLEETTLTPRDPRWIGAWWLGFLVFGLGGLVVSIPLFFFPRRMIPRDQYVVQTETKRRKSICTHIKELFKSVLRLTTNPVYMCLVLGNCATLLGMSGMMAFLPKYIEVQFQLPAWKANIMLGALNVISASGGTVAGGIITSKLKLRPITCLIFLLCIAVVSVILNAAGFFLGCPQPEIVGDHARDLISSNTSGLCSTSCSCHDDYFPVCGEDGINYFSPCHAGCSASVGQLYTACTCISGNSTAVPALCESGCDNLYPYVAIVFFAAFAATLGMMPGFNVLLRSVPEADKPLAVGLSAFLSTLLGWFPGPVSFGKLIDTTCLRWTASCSGSGACVLYNLVAFKARYHMISVATRGAAVLLYLLAFFAARKKKRAFYLEEPTGKTVEKQNFLVKTETNGGLRQTRL